MVRSSVGKRRVEGSQIRLDRRRHKKPHTALERIMLRIAKQENYGLGGF